MRFHFISIRLTKIKKAFTKPSETGYRTTGTLIHPWRECLENSLMIFGKVKDVHILHPPILCLVHTSKKFLSVHIRNVCNNIHSSPWIAKKSGNYWNMHCHGNDLDKDVVYSASGILHSSKKMKYRCTKWSGSITVLTEKCKSQKTTISFVEVQK